MRGDSASFHNYPHTRMTALNSHCSAGTVATEGTALVFRDLIDGCHQVLLGDTEPAFTDGSRA